VLQSKGLMNQGEKIMSRKMLVSVVVLCALLAVPFNINTGNAAKSNPAAAQGRAQDGFKTYDDKLAEMSMRFPGFAGMFIDETGILQVSMVGQNGRADLSLMSHLGQDLDREFGEGASLSARGMEFSEAQYDFLTRHIWHQQMASAVLDIAGVVYSDNNERTGNLEFGITDTPGTKEAVEEALDKLGIPREAAVFSETKEMEPFLRARRRPLRGGLQINFSGFLCTLGFIATRAGVNGFVTNSHCTATQGGVQGTVYHQPTASGTTNRIGQEIADPNYFTGGQCPANRRCRFSDSSFARVPHPSGPSVTTARGTIARPAVNSFNWNGVDVFNIVGEGNAVVGQSVTKVGRTTGRTSGTVSQTCVNTNVSGTTITQLCQTFANYGNGGGDSGSPVFRITTLPNVILSGINWGGNGTISVFSPIT
jgi:hypothetical protein